MFGHAVRRLLLLPPLLALSACATYEVESAPEGDELAAGQGGIPVPKGDQVTACFYGAATGNPDDAAYDMGNIDELCQGIPGVVRYEPGQIIGLPIIATLKRFTTTLPHYALPFHHRVEIAQKKIIQAMDTNGDGNIDRNDSPKELNLIGYSWGAFRATQLADDLRKQYPTLRVKRLVIIDAYKSNVLGLPPKDIDIPSNVDNVVNFRHSVASRCDSGCGGPIAVATGVLLGPAALVVKEPAFTGRRPRVKSAATRCYSTDVSRISGRSGPLFNHCDVPDVAFAAIRQMFRSDGSAPWNYSRGFPFRYYASSNSGLVSTCSSKDWSFETPISQPEIRGKDVVVSSLNDFAAGAEACLGGGTGAFSEEDRDTLVDPLLDRNDLVEPPATTEP